MKKNFITSILYAAIATVLLSVIYPLAVTGLAQMLAKDQANGQLIKKDGVTVGSRILAQPFSSARYFHARPSAAGTNGFDATNSGGTNWGPTNQKLIDRIKNETAALQSENPEKPVPVDLVTASGSGLDPHITPAAAEFQIARVAKARGITEGEIRKVVTAHIELRQFGFLGEPRVNVLELNLVLDEIYPGH